MVQFYNFIIGNKLYIVQYQITANRKRLQTLKQIASYNEPNEFVAMTIFRIYKFLSYCKH